MDSRLKENAIPLARAVFGSEEERAVCDVLRSGWVSHGPRVVEFENVLADYLGCRYVRAVNSGSSAILLALKAVGVGPGDSVIVPAFTCAATALPILCLGAEVVFADIDLSSFNMSWADAERVVKRNTKAILLVHIFGRMADAPAFVTACEQRGISLIEDACLSLGARMNGRAAGTFGVAGCYSFHPRKMITTGEGGAVATDDDTIAGSIERDRNYGAARSAWSRFQTNVGELEGFERMAYNFKLTDIQAAIGIVQMMRLSDFIQEHHRIAAAYREQMEDLPGIELPTRVSEECDVNQAFTCRWAPLPANELLSDETALARAVSSLRSFKASMISEGVAVSDAGQFLPGLPVFRAAGTTGELLRGQYPSAYLAGSLSFALPMFPWMRHEDQARIVDRVTSLCRSSCL